MSKKASECVRVVVRCRPLSEKEVAAGYGRVVDMDVQRGVVTISNPRGRMDEPPREFTFDAVYDWNSRQRDLYDETFRTVVDSVLEGYNGTIFAYGQTGTGKTYTMEGIRSNPEERGVIPNSFDHIFTHIARTENKKFLVRTSYLEIYQDEVRDLLSKDQKKRLELKERADTGVYVKDLSAFVAKSVKEIEHVMNVGNQNRSVGATDMNEHSSRSHAVFIVTVECAEKGPDGEDHIRVGKLNLVDLAGSERQAKTGSTGQRFKEATRINLSLSALGNVISALVDGKSSHIPYRDSKLTRLLQDSLGGNAKTCMVATIGPADYNHEESLTTLRYANRAKNIKNQPRINEDPQDALLREYQEEIAKLKNVLEKRSKRGSKEKHHRKRGGAEGEGEGEEAANLELTLKEEQAQLEQEKEAILKNQELLEEERQSLLASTQDRAEQLKKEQKKRDSLASKIKAMESKLLAGGLNIFDRTNEQERELQQQRQKMIEQKRREREIQQQLMAKEESAMEMRETFASLQEEVEHKTKKLNKLRSKLKAAKAELEEQKREQARAREELVIILENLQKELKLRTLIVDNFIPPEVTQRVCDRAMYSEEEETWTLPPFRGVESNEPGLKRPVSALGNIRPIATHAREAAITGNPRYKAENILQLELDMPTRTTHDYEGAGMAPLVQAVLDAALNEEGEDLTIDATTIEDVTGGLGVPKSHQRKKQRRRKPSKESSSGLQQSGQAQQTQHFPSKRGLVQTGVRFA